jgi:hypothetical protein
MAKRALNAGHPVFSPFRLRLLSVCLCSIPTSPPRESPSVHRTRHNTRFCHSSTRRSRSVALPFPWTSVIQCRARKARLKIVLPSNQRTLCKQLAFEITGRLGTFRIDQSKTRRFPIYEDSDPGLRQVSEFHYALRCHEARAGP